MVAVEHFGAGGEAPGVSAGGGTSRPRDKEEDRLAVQLAREAIGSVDYLTVLQKLLTGTEKPLPAVGVSIGNLPGTDLPETYISYAETVPGEGLRPAKHVQGTGDQRRVRYGLALPMDQTGQRSVTFFPHEHDGDGQARPSQTTGYWQQWRSDRFTIHRPGEQPKITEYPDNDMSAGTNEIFSGRYMPGLGFPVPRFMTDPAEARDEVGRAVNVVRDLPEPWGEKCEEDGGHIRQHFIALGAPAVLFSLDALETKSAGDAAPPQPLVDMLDTVAADLGLPR